MAVLRRPLVVGGLLTAAALVLAGCGGGSDADTSGDGGADKLSVVASTNVYGQIAEEVGGDLVEVKSIIDSASKDPHSFEPSAQDQLTVQRADLIVENGGGYDAFVDALIESSGSKAPVITAAELSDHGPGAGAEGEEHGHEGEGEEGHGHIEGFNEHVWYDLHVAEAVADHVAEELGKIAPDNAQDFEANAKAFKDEVAGLEDELGKIKTAHDGAAVFLSEPVPGYLAEAAGLKNVTPEEFSEAVEEGQDVPPATVSAALTLLTSADVRVVIANPQTQGAETTKVIDEANTLKIPVIEFTETLPEGDTYVSWMTANIKALSDGLGS